MSTGIACRTGSAVIVMKRSVVTATKSTADTTVVLIVVETVTGMTGIETGVTVTGMTMAAGTKH